MIKHTALKYYLFSISTIALSTNFWNIPFLIIKKQLLIRLRNGSKFFVENLMDIWIIKEVILDNQYQLPKHRELSTVIDIGAGIGDFSILASNFSKKVFAFEKNKSRVELLKKNIKINNVDNIQVHRKTIKSLDEIFNKFKINKCDFIKIDCESCEYRVFNNTSKSTLAKIFSIAMEVHFFNSKQKLKYSLLKKRLKSNGFILKEVENPVHESILLLFAERLAKNKSSTKNN